MPEADALAALRVPLGLLLIVYTIGMYALSFWARGRIHNAEDYVVAGRRLPFSLAWATLLATWFGAGTLLTAADEVRSGGLERAALDPFGAGLCLILAGLFFAGPLWRMGLLTVSDFFRRRFGPRAELLSALIMVPSYFGWIAAQFVALAGVLHLLFGVDMAAGIAIVAVVGTGYTLLGGMWSVTLTDAVQMSLVILGLGVLGWEAMAGLGGGSLAVGWQRLVTETPPEMLAVVPAHDLVGWLSVLTVGALGNLPGQDLMQRVFSARSPGVARAACVAAGAGYLLIGLIPLMLALASRLVFPEDTGRAILPALAHLFLSPMAAALFLLAIVSAVLSTIDSALLSPATVLAQNVAAPLLGLEGEPGLGVHQSAVGLVALASLALAYAGESAYSLLESSYELTLVGLFVPLALGLHRPPGREAPAVAAMVGGVGVWLLHSLLGWDAFLAPWLEPRGWSVPVSLAATAVSLVAWLLFLRGGRSHSSVQST
ncbi:MAG: sodium:solute symporter family protein [Thermoanaerobaculia bacterium]